MAFIPLISLILGFLPGFAWLIFYVKEEETHPEPRWLILFAFAAGIVFGLIAVVFESLLTTAAAGFSISEFSIAALGVFALVEETMKFSAAYLVIGKSRIARNPVDLMIYLIVAALGFATLENVGALTTFLSTAHGAGMTSSFVASFAEALSLRFVGATLLHSLTSGIVGYYWALGMLQGKVKRYLSLGLVIAAVLHALFNLLILNYGSFTYALIFLTLLGFFVLSDFEKLKITTREGPSQK
jgi:RsiW-degrading membrane proteinase PrsW (M82 family)